MSKACEESGASPSNASRAASVIIERSPAPVKKVELSLRTAVRAVASSGVHSCSGEESAAIVHLKSANRTDAHLPRSVGVSGLTRPGRVPLQIALR